MLNSSAILATSMVVRETFDPANPKHLESLDVFLSTGSWGEVKFHFEYPYHDVVTTVLMKFARHERQIRQETPIEREHRLAVKPNLVRTVKFESAEEHQARLKKASEQITKE